MVSIKIRKHNNITSREKDNKVKGFSELRQRCLVNAGGGLPNN